MNSLPSTSQMREPWALVMNSGYGVAPRPSPWTPPGETTLARANSFADSVVVIGQADAGSGQDRRRARDPDRGSSWFLHRVPLSAAPGSATRVVVPLAAAA